jgi:hypothetical protein
MAIINPVAFLQNRTDHPARGDRLAISALLESDGTALSWREGVRGPLDLKVTQRGAGANMSVDIAAGQGFVKQDNAGNGCYVVTNDATINQAITTADPTNPRKDLICLKVEDAFFSGANNLGSLAYVQGVAAASPVDPAAPVNSIILARINVAAAAASIVNANIQDLRPQTAALGGSHTVVDNTERNALTAWAGRMVYNLASNRLEVYNGTSWVPVGVADTFAGTEAVQAGAAPPAGTVKVVKSGRISGTTSGGGAITVTFQGGAFSNGLVGVTVTPAGTGGSTEIYQAQTTSYALTGTTVTCRDRLGAGLTSTAVALNYVAVGW